MPGCRRASRDREPIPWVFRSRPGFPLPQHRARRQAQVAPESRRYRAGRPARPAGQSAGSAEGRPKGQHSILVNDSWRICFAWRSAGAHNVDFTDACVMTTLAMAAKAVVATGWRTFRAVSARLIASRPPTGHRRSAPQRPAAPRAGRSRPGRRDTWAATAGRISP